MSEFAEILKEAFVGEAPFDPHPGEEVLRASIDKFDRRLRTVRFMTWFAVGFMGAAMALAVVMFLRAPPDASAKVLTAWAGLFLWAMAGIGFAKHWFAMMQNDIGLRKELKRTQLMILDLRQEP
jgi:hypothetical protein